MWLLHSHQQLSVALAAVVLVVFEAEAEGEAEGEAEAAIDPVESTPLFYCGPHAPQPLTPCMPPAAHAHCSPTASTPPGFPPPARHACHYRHLHRRLITTASATTTTSMTTRALPLQPPRSKITPTTHLSH